MSDYDVTDAARADDVVTLTLVDASGLAVGEHVHVYNVGYGIDGAHVLLTVDEDSEEVTFRDRGADLATTEVAGILVDYPSWITLEDLELFIGNLTDADDIDYAEGCVDAANEWAYMRRHDAGYHDNPTVCPGPRVKQGTVLYAGALFREKGSPGDQFQAFQGAPITPLVGGMGQIMRLLGIGRPQVA